MSTTELRSSIQGFLNRISDEKVLQAYYILLQNMVQKNDNEIVAYSSNQEAISKLEANNRIDFARAEIQKGNFISQEELERISENW